MVSIKIRGVKEAKRDLEAFAKRAVPYAMRNAVNSAAFLAQREWRGEVRSSFTTRNRFTERSIQVDKARGLNAKRAVAMVGSTADYMRKQEFGGTVRGSGRHKAIPAPSAAGQAPGSKRTRVVRAAYRLSAIKAQRQARGVRGPARQRALVTILQAKRAGRRFVVLPRKNGGKGLYLITGGRRKFKTRLLYDVSRGSVRVPPQPTLTRTLDRIEVRVQQLHYKALLDELRRHKVAGY